MARFDGMEMLSFMIGSALSPLVNEAGGNYATYAVELGLITASLVYVLTCVKESRKREERDVDKGQSKKTVRLIYFEDFNMVGCFSSVILSQMWVKYGCATVWYEKLLT